MPGCCNSSHASGYLLLAGRGTLFASMENRGRTRQHSGCALPDRAHRSGIVGRHHDLSPLTGGSTPSRVRSATFIFQLLRPPARA